jgi:4-hydroxy-4-methyl-2-oxoglutarate aldolase
MYEIIEDFERPPKEIVDSARDLYVCLVGCELGPRFVMDPGITPLERDWRVCGPAFTVRPEHTDDVLMGMYAGKYVKPGDVVVIDAAGDKRAAALGASMTFGIKEAGGAGIIVDGYVLTAEIIRKREGVPVFCRGAVARTGKSESPGWLNVPVICGGVIVNPGDLILGDEDGVVVIPREMAAEVVERTAGGRNDGTVRPKDGVFPDREPMEGRYYERRGVEEKLKMRKDVIWK